MESNIPARCTLYPIFNSKNTFLQLSFYALCKAQSKDSRVLGAQNRYYGWASLWDGDRTLLEAHSGKEQGTSLNTISMLDRMPAVPYMTAGLDTGTGCATNEWLFSFETGDDLLYQVHQS